MKLVKVPQLAWYEPKELEIPLPYSWQVEIAKMAGYDHKALTPDEIKKTIQNADCSCGYSNDTEEGMEQLIYQKMASTANFLQMKGEFKIAAQVWQEAAELFGEKHEKRIRIELGNNYYRQKRYEKAVQIIQSVLDSDPNNDIGWFLLGDCHAATKHHDLASEAYVRAININPQKAGYRVHYAENLMRLGQLAEAEEEIKIALSQEPWSIPALKTHAMLLEQMGQKGYNKKLAAEVYRRVLHLDPRDREAAKCLRKLLR